VNVSWEHFKELNKVKGKYIDCHLDKCIVGSKIVEIGSQFILKPQSLILTGDPGRGKTYFSYCLVRGTVEKFGIASTRWFKSKQLDDRIVQEMSKFGSASSFINSLCEVPFLFIDDFGVDRDTERAQRDYYEIIDNRWEDEKPTIISTNLSPKRIEETYGERIFSRFKDSKWIKFTGPDLRGK